MREREGDACLLGMLLQVHHTVIIVLCSFFLSLIYRLATCDFCCLGNCFPNPLSTCNLHYHHHYHLLCLYLHAAASFLSLHFRRDEKTKDEPANCLLRYHHHQHFLCLSIMSGQILLLIALATFQVGR